MDDLDDDDDDCALDASGGEALTISEASAEEFAFIWPVLEPIARGGREYLWPTDVTADDAKGLWFLPGARVFVAEDGKGVLGTAYLRPNALGPGGHIGNAGFAVAEQARGRGVGRALGEHVIEAARAAGFAAIQYNAVVSSNAPAVKLWRDLGFEVAGTIPGGFRHPEKGAVDLLIMFRAL